MLGSWHPLQPSLMTDRSWFTNIPAPWPLGLQPKIRMVSTQYLHWLLSLPRPLPHFRACNRHTSQICYSPIQAYLREIASSVPGPRNKAHTAIKRVTRIWRLPGAYKNYVYTILYCTIMKKFELLGGLPKCDKETGSEQTPLEKWCWWTRLLQGCHKPSVCNKTKQNKQQQQQKTQYLQSTVKQGGPVNPCLWVASGEIRPKTCSDSALSLLEFSLTKRSHVCSESCLRKFVVDMIG